VRYEAASEDTRRENYHRKNGTECDKTDDITPPNAVAIQTDLTAAVVSALECSYQKRMEDIACRVVRKLGYPTKDDFKGNEKLLRFCTGLSSFTVLMALFHLVSGALPEGGAAKLSKFEYFTLTLMKLRLNASNYDLAFRFGISESSVCRTFSKWIEAMDIWLSFLIIGIAFKRLCHFGFDKIMG